MTGEKKTGFSLLASFVTLALGAPAAALASEGHAVPWQLGFQPAATPVMERLNDLHNMLLVIITVVTVIVLMLMTYICIRFRRKRNPVPSKIAHNNLIEIIWTGIPVLILIAIAYPSLKLHYYMAETVAEPEMTLKVVGYQWYWHYEYPDHGGFGYDSYMKKETDLKDGEPRLLEVDNRVVVPVNTNVRVQITGADVIHAWAMPAFGVKTDAVPGRLNETWFRAEKTGVFYGQCSELCGVNHGFMPIAIEVVSKDEFNNWVAQQQKTAGITPAAAAAPAKAQ